MSYSNKPIQPQPSQELKQRIRTDGWNRAVAACIEIVCPTYHKEEERSCEDIKKELEKLYRQTRIVSYGKFIP